MEDRWESPLFLNTGGAGMGHQRNLSTDTGTLRPWVSDFDGSEL